MHVEENVIARTNAVAFGRGRVYTVRMQVGCRRWAALLLGSLVACTPALLSCPLPALALPF